MFRTLRQLLNRIRTVHNALFIVFPKQGFIYNLADKGLLEILRNQLVKQFEKYFMPKKFLFCLAGSDRLMIRVSSIFSFGINALH